MRKNSVRITALILMLLMMAVPLLGYQAEAETATYNVTKIKKVT